MKFTQLNLCYNPEFDTCTRKKRLEPLNLKGAERFFFSHFLSNVFLFLEILKIFFISCVVTICKSV